MGIKWGQRGRRGRSREPSLVPSPLLACRRSHRTCPAYRFCPTCDTSCPLDPLAAHMTHLQHTWPTCGTLALPGPLGAHLQPTWSTWPTCGPLAAHLPSCTPLAPLATRLTHSTFSGTWTNCVMCVVKASVRAGNRSFFPEKQVR